MRLRYVMSLGNFSLVHIWVFAERQSKEEGKENTMFSLQHNHFFCNENTNPDLRSFIMPEEGKGEEGIFAGNR